LGELLLGQGHKVSGCDIKLSPILTHLQELGAKVFTEHRAENLSDDEQPVDVVVVSSAIDKHNPEWEAAKAQGIPIFHRGEVLADLMRLKCGIAVAGTHGKTTTTSLMAAALAGHDPTVVIGGLVHHLGSHGCVGQGDLFLAEADESDGSFLRLSPTVAVITNIDRDHLNYYGSFDKILDAFRTFVRQLPFYGSACVCLDDPGVQMLLPDLRTHTVTYGLHPDAQIRADNIAADGFTTSFVPVVLGKSLPVTTLHMPGTYNVVNALATFAVGVALGLDLEPLRKGLEQFSGVERRFTLLGHVGRVCVIDDYAHNPKKIQTVLKGTRQAFPGHHIIAVFQPHRYSRLRSQGDEFAQSFADANQVIVTPLYTAGELPQPEDQEIEAQLPAKIQRESFLPDSPARTVLTTQSLGETIEVICQEVKVVEKNVIVLLMGAGDLRSIGSTLLKNLELL
jgi:UDP-N-acetylmuramate--alanine ligase